MTLIYCETWYALVCLVSSCYASIHLSITVYDSKWIIAAVNIFEKVRLFAIGFVVAINEWALVMKVGDFNTSQLN